MTGPDTIEITFEGRVIAAREGESIAAALTRAGIYHLRTTQSGEPRGIYCGMGVCQDCLVEVDGCPAMRASKPDAGTPGRGWRHPRSYARRTSSARIAMPARTLSGGCA